MQVEDPISGDADVSVRNACVSRGSAATLQ
jgi:hypothetical protein